ncbi:MAG TPA: hydroxyacid dehydrogenase [Candidatus Kaiserbacteria bacterium]|nr:hydroxyacid dehydrogenase [Candidatus Kaiserbacteria bacterium]
MKLVYIAEEDWEEEYLKDKLTEAGWETEFRMTNGDEPLKGDSEAEALSVFIMTKLGANEMDLFPKLKLIATRSTGFDHIDLQEAKKRGITVCTVPSYGVNTVAEFAFALILALSRNIYDAYKRVSNTGSFSQEGLRGFDLAGKTIGVVGTGHIGVKAIQMAKGFAMNVLAFDAFPKEGLDKEFGFTYVPLNELLNKSDIVTLHVPYNPDTHHLINKDNIHEFKKGSYLINTARGAVVETEAIITALQEKVLAGAGLDVLEEEGDIQDEARLFKLPHPREEELKTTLANHYLIDHPRVIVTAHIAFDSQEAVERILDTTAENLGAFAKGEPQNTIEPKGE